MSIFNTSNMTTLEACEGYSVEFGGNFDAIMESYDDDLAVIEAMHAYDMAELEAGEGNYTPAMEGALADIWAKIKAFFKNLVQKILAFFRSIGDYINSLVMSGTDFAKKYESRLKALKLNGMPFEMFKYDIKVDSAKKGLLNFKGVTDEVKKYMDDISALSVEDENASVTFTRLDEKYEDLEEKKIAKYRKELSGEEDAEKYSSALYKMFRGGSDTKTEFKINSVTEYVNILAKVSDYEKYIKDAQGTVKTAFGNVEKTINKAASEAEKVKDEKFASVASKKAAYMRRFLGSYSKVNSLYTQYLNAWSSALREATGTYKSLCFKALTYKDKK